MIDLKTCDSGTTWAISDVCTHPESNVMRCKDSQCGCAICLNCGEWVEIPGTIRKST